MNAEQKNFSEYQHKMPDWLVEELLREPGVEDGTLVARIMGGKKQTFYVFLEKDGPFVKNENDSWFFWDGNIPGWDQH